ncbi:hypothetical protein CDD80_3831 [Ophiocordyceps camponoti-rufipedis]|uniref:Antigenic cell wall galactomannoprotein n=1 Tax=Ophiocordyceps camponoti-rufipedis TaxID=2004952 RepID=A0A2C5XIB2_9HYPO|nr:hypothetical protein CDD80_3831 [Ophiocordyceps camponoti-rufipedis]
MLLSTLLVPLTATLAASAALDMQAAPANISDAIAQVSHEAETFGKVLTDWNGMLLTTLPIVTSSARLYHSLQKGTRAAEASKPLTEDEALAMAADAQTLSQTVNKTLEAVIAVKPKFDRLWLSGVILGAMEIERKEAVEFIDAVVDKVPEGFRPLAKRIVQGMLDGFEKTIAAYRP